MESQTIVYPTRLYQHTHTSASGKTCSCIVVSCFEKVVVFLLQTAVLKLLPRCLAAAHTVLGVHPFPRLDVLIVPAGFSSLGMAR